MGKHIHRISNIRADLRVADCAGCGPDSPITYKANKASWRCKAADRRESPNAGRARQLRYRFGIDLAEYDRLLRDQGNACAICQDSCQTGLRLAVDHDHDTGAIRGLLCNRCNRAIGLFGDRSDLLARAATYLS